MMKLLFQIIILFFPLNIITAQVISNLQLAKDYTKPLSDDDIGITIDYRIESCGKVSAYLKENNNTYVLFSDEQEFYGDGKIIVSKEKLLSWFGCNRSTTYNNYTLTFTHISCRKSIYSEKQIPLRLMIDAPYGCVLKDYPDKPQLYSTNNMVKKSKPTSKIGIVVGLGLAASGLGYQIYHIEGEKGNDLNSTAGGLMLSGLIVTLISVKKNAYYEPDIYTNKQNESYNNVLLTNWKDECRNIDNYNNVIKQSFTVKLKIIL